MTFRPHSARQPATVLRETKPLQQLLAEAGRLSTLQALLDQQLEPAAREHCKVGSYKAGCLTLIISDGQWATRLRYQQKRLLKLLAAYDELANLTKILFKVQPPNTSSRGTSRTLTLSIEAASAIRASAEHITDPRLRDALERLAKHAKDA